MLTTFSSLADCVSNQKQENIILINSFSGLGPSPDQWNTIDMKGLIPENAKEVNLVGIFTIIRGLNLEDSTLEIFFRASGYPLSTIYISPIMGPFIEGEQRSTMNIWVPLSPNQRFDFWWTGTNYCSWPEWSAYLINLSFNAWR